MPNVTATTVDAYINDVYDPELNRSIEFNLVIANQFSDWTKRWGTGDVLHVRARHNLTANTKSAGSEATPEAITETEQTFTTSTHQIVAQEIEDMAQVMVKYDLRKEFIDAAAYALARAMEVACAALFDDNTTQTVGTLNAELTNDNLLRAWQYLKDSAAQAPFKGIISPAAWTGLLKVEQFIQQLYNGDTQGRAIHEAQIGKVYQATFYVSQLTVGTAPNSSGHIWAGDHFFKNIMKRPTTDAWKSPLAKAWVLASDQVYGMFERQEAVEAAGGTTVARLHGVRLQTLK